MTNPIRNPTPQPPRTPRLCVNQGTSFAPWASWRWPSESLCPRNSPVEQNGTTRNISRGHRRPQTQRTEQVGTRWNVLRAHLHPRTRTMEQIGTTWNVLLAYRRSRTRPMERFGTTWNVLLAHHRPRTRSMEQFGTTRNIFADYFHPADPRVVADAAECHRLQHATLDFARSHRLPGDAWSTDPLRVRNRRRCSSPWPPLPPSGACERVGMHRVSPAPCPRTTHLVTATHAKIRDRLTRSAIHLPPSGDLVPPHVPHAVLFDFHE